VTTEAVCWEWLNAMSHSSTRIYAARALERVRQDARIEVIPFTPEFTAEALRLFGSRSDKDWSLTDCLSFVVMNRRNIWDALTPDRHFGQVGFRAVLSDLPPA